MRQLTREKYDKDLELIQSTIKNMGITKYRLAILVGAYPNLLSTYGLTRPIPPHFREKIIDLTLLDKKF